MSLLGVAAKLGVSTSALEDLLRGQVSIGVAAKFGAPSASIGEFIDGRASIGVAGATGIPAAALQELRDEIGRDGAIALVLGICIGKDAGE